VENEPLPTCPYGSGDLRRLDFKILGVKAAAAAELTAQVSLKSARGCLATPFEQTWPLLDHLVGKCQHRRGYREADHFCRLEVYDKFEFSWLFNR
jgi:hypothetical protein